MNKKIVSIAIPFYNGFETAKLILDELGSDYESEYDILISDDCSIESESLKLKNYLDLKFSNSNIKYYRNTENLGMDINFEKCISLSKSDYTWFMGQDDFIYKNNLIKVVNSLINIQPSVVYLNYEVQRTWNYNKKFIHTKNLNTEFGNDINTFYKISKGNLPHFLPSLIVRTELWPKQEILNNFYGTYFIQLGAFLSILSEHKSWLYIGEPMSIGMIPETGWQSSLKNKVKIYAGFMTCIKRSNEIYENLKQICHHQYFKNYYQHLSLSIESKLEKSNELIIILKSPVTFTKSFILITEIVESAPFFLLNTFRFIRKKYFGIKNILFILKNRINH